MNKTTPQKKNGLLRTEPGHPLEGAFLWLDDGRSKTAPSRGLPVLRAGHALMVGSGEPLPQDLVEQTWGADPDGWPDRIDLAPEDLPYGLTLADVPRIALLMVPAQTPATAVLDAKGSGFAISSRRAAFVETLPLSHTRGAKLTLERIDERRAFRAGEAIHLQAGDMIMVSIVPEAAPRDYEVPLMTLFLPPVTASRVDQEMHTHSYEALSEEQKEAIRLLRIWLNQAPPRNPRQPASLSWPHLICAYQAAFALYPHDDPRPVALDYLQKRGYASNARHNSIKATVAWRTLADEVESELTAPELARLLKFEPDEINREGTSFADWRRFIGALERYPELFTRTNQARWLQEIRAHRELGNVG